MKYYEITITSLRYDITPVKFVERIGNNMNQAELKESLESSFRRVIPEGRIRVSSIKQIGIADYLKYSNTGMVYAGAVVCQKIKAAKQAKWKKFFTKTLNIKTA